MAAAAFSALWRQEKPLGTDYRQYFVAVLFGLVLFGDGISGEPGRRSDDLPVPEFYVLGLRFFAVCCCGRFAVSHENDL